MAKILFYLERKLAAAMLKLLRLSLRFEVSNRNPDSQRCIYMFWHRNLMLLALHRVGSPIVIVVSASQDGELIAGPAEELGYISVRGSSSRQGHRALKAMIDYSATHQLAITPDGPKGPPKIIHPGIFQIALLGKIPIIPVVADADREWVFKSWDRFRFPKPFAKLRFIYGDPIYINSKTEIAEREIQVQNTMRELEERLTRLQKQGF